MKAWNELEQWRIQHWIERIPYHIQQVLELEGGNEYLEGHPAGVKRDKEYWKNKHRQRLHSIKETYKVHNQAWLLFKCSTKALPSKMIAYLKSLLGIKEVIDVEELNGDQWNHLPTTDQIISIDSISRTGNRAQQRKSTSHNGIKKRGRKPGVPAFKVKFQKPLIPEGFIIAPTPTNFHIRFQDPLTLLNIPRS